MSIELKQAAQQAVDAFDAFGDADDFASLFELTQKMRALRTAIQQAEAQQPSSKEHLTEPDAALIAAARDLLAAAIKVNALSIQSDAHKELRAAIAKALDHEA